MCLQVLQYKIRASVDKRRGGGVVTGSAVGPVGSRAWKYFTLAGLTGTQKSRPDRGGSS